MNNLMLPPPDAAPIGHILYNENSIKKVHVFLNTNIHNNPLGMPVYMFSSKDLVWCQFNFDEFNRIWTLTRYPRIYFRNSGRSYYQSKITLLGIESTI